MLCFKTCRDEFSHDLEESLKNNVLLQKEKKKREKEIFEERTTTLLTPTYAFYIFKVKKKNKKIDLFHKCKQTKIFKRWSSKCVLLYLKKIIYLFICSIFKNIDRLLNQRENVKRRETRVIF